MEFLVVNFMWFFLTQLSSRKKSLNVLSQIKYLFGNKKVSEIYKKLTKRFQYLLQIILIGMFYFL